MTWSKDDPVGAPFARKFTKDDPVLNKIDKELLRRSDGHFTPGGSVKVKVPVFSVAVVVGSIRGSILEPPLEHSSHYLWQRNDNTVAS
ncbi:hypothetical protein D0Y65_006514 [Glycine soja]|uniref:Uncharacterized protein n=1 Tax=Glycine soja TaxID=3848 RepID=A0A445L9W9_GLYSO|nr:hypothetical protein D0Y65_006514 [Glycine soja]